jgi:hypothetical protein
MTSRRRRNVGAFAVAVVITLVLGACAGDDADASQNEAQPDADACRNRRGGYRRGGYRTGGDRTGGDRTGGDRTTICSWFNNAGGQSEDVQRRCQMAAESHGLRGSGQGEVRGASEPGGPLLSVAKSVASSSTEPLVLVASEAYSAVRLQRHGTRAGCELGGRGERVAEIYDVSVVAEGAFMNIGFADHRGQPPGSLARYRTAAHGAVVREPVPAIPSREIVATGSRRGASCRDPSWRAWRSQ